MDMYTPDVIDERFSTLIKYHKSDSTYVFACMPNNKENTCGMCILCIEENELPRIGDQFGIQLELTGPLE